MKAGTMGHSLVSSVRELPYITNNTKIMASLEVMGGEGLVRKIKELRECVGDISPFKDPYLGKLSVFGDKEGKTRIVAIVDYWTQSVLKNYHEFLMAELKKLEADCTFNQDNYKRLLTLPGPFQSIDLSNATDRMPL
jgi:hypothetical protein